MSDIENGATAIVEVAEANQEKMSSPLPLKRKSEADSPGKKVLKTDEVAKVGESEVAKVGEPEVAEEQPSANGTANAESNVAIQEAPVQAEPEKPEVVAEKTEEEKDVVTAGAEATDSGANPESTEKQPEVVPDAEATEAAA